MDDGKCVVCVDALVVNSLYSERGDTFVCFESEGYITNEILHENRVFVGLFGDMLFACEGVAKHLFETFDALVRSNTEGRAWITRIHLLEDSKNSATYLP